MSNLFNTFGRAALVAIGLTFAASASAQTNYSFNCPAGYTTSITGGGSPSVTVSCVAAATKCVISGPTTGQVGLNITLTATCPGSGALVWTGGNAANCTGSSCQFNDPAGTVQYTAARANDATTLSDPYSVVWSTSVVAPTACSLTASPDSGTAGYGATLTATCGSGTTPITLAWSTTTGASVANCPITMAGLSTTCNVTGINQSGSFTVNFLNTAGNNNKSDNVSVSSGGDGEYANCPSGTLTSNSFYPVTGTGNTLNIGELYDGRWMVIKVVPSTSSTSVRKKSAVFGTSYSPDPNVQWSLSTKACDLSDANAVSYAGQKVKGSTGSDLTFGYTYGPSGSTYNGYPVSMVRGQPYYLNIYTNSGCPSSGSGCWYTNSSFE